MVLSSTSMMYEHDDGASAAVSVGGRVECGDKVVLREAVVSANHAEDNEVALGANSCSKARHDADLVEGVDVAEDDVAQSS